MRVNKFAVVFLLSITCVDGFAARPSDKTSRKAKEDAMFGFPTSTASPSSSPTNTSKDRDAMELDGVSKPDAFASGEIIDNALSIGGLFYQRSVISAQKGATLAKTPLSTPLQFDGFLDARPSDRVRGFVDARLFYDSSRGSGGSGSLQFASTSAAPTGFSGSTVASNPTVGLDQAWLKFDIDRTFFITAGKQHVKWGPSRFWNPTDFLNPQRRDPLLPYDMRLGNTMLKLAVPWESTHSNLYAIALFDTPQAASTLGQVGGALRAETVIGGAELGLDFVARGARTPVYGADVSTQLGPFDFYAEASVITTAPSPMYQVSTTLPAGADLSSLVTSSHREGPFVQATGGLNYSFAWKDSRQAVIGAEYFHNGLGYPDASVYPALIFFGQYQPFYTGRDYAALYITVEGPDAEKHTNYTFSTLANLSDASFISRLDFSWRFLSYLTFEAYGDVHYGTEGGEFNFSLSTPNLTYQGAALAAVNIPRTLFDIGFALRLAF